VERYSTDHRIRKPDVTEKFRTHLHRLERRIRELGATPIYVYGPTVGGFLLNQMKAEGRIDGSLFDTAFFMELARRQAEEAGIRFINLEPLLQAKYDQGEVLNFAGDAHFNGPTSLLIGEYLYQELAPDGTSASE